MVEVDFRNLTSNAGHTSPLNSASLRMSKRGKDFK